MGNLSNTNAGAGTSNDDGAPCLRYGDTFRLNAGCGVDAETTEKVKNLQ